MNKSLVLRLNSLYSKYIELESFENSCDDDRLRQAVIDGLSESCIFLKNIISDDVLMNMQNNSGTLNQLQHLHSIKRLDEFLIVERKLLECSGLNAELIDRLIETVAGLGKSNEYVMDWRGKLNEFKDIVCNTAQEFSSQSRYKQKLQRVMICGGGALLVYLNTFPPFGVDASHLSLSRDVGFIIIGSASDWR